MTTQIKQPNCVSCGAPSNQRCLICRKSLHRLEGDTLVTECARQHYIKSHSDVAKARGWVS